MSESRVGPGAELVQVAAGAEIGTVGVEYHADAGLRRCLCERRH